MGSLSQTRHEIWRRTEPRWEIKAVFIFLHWRLTFFGIVFGKVALKTANECQSLCRQFCFVKIYSTTYQEGLGMMGHTHVFFSLHFNIMNTNQYWFFCMFYWLLGCKRELLLKAKWISEWIKCWFFYFLPWCRFFGALSRTAKPQQTKLPLERKLARLPMTYKHKTERASEGEWKEKSSSPFTFNFTLNRAHKSWQPSG